LRLWYRGFGLRGSWGEIGEPLHGLAWRCELARGLA
jgi:hypothetical protein